MCFCLLIFFLIFTCIIRLIYILFTVRKHKAMKLSTSHCKSRKITTMVIAGSGGHTTEILRLVSCIGQHYSPRHYVIADTDSMSHAKIEQVEHQKSLLCKDSKYVLHMVPRSREVKQSYFTSIGSTLYATVYSIPLVFKILPDLILCNGPGTCIPLCASGFLLTFLGLKKVHIVYIESVCRVTSLSLSGKLLYHFADHMVVQWPQLSEQYPLTEYMGRL